jgi:hypothetical protein
MKGEGAGEGWEEEEVGSKPEHGHQAIPLLMPEAAVNAQDADSDIHTPDSRPKKHNLANVSPAFLTQSFSICITKNEGEGRREDRVMFVCGGGQQMKEKRIGERTRRRRLGWREG